MILVRAAAPGGAAGEGRARVAVHVSIQPGYDPSYPWKQIGTTAGQAKPPGLDYYLAPAEKGGEPPGVWGGRGLALLGLAAGTVVEREVFEKLFGQDHLDPRDPTGTTRLGRKAQQFASADDIFARMAAAEPQASPGRLAELRSLARAQTRRAVPYWDVTISLSKTISLWYGSLLAMAEDAGQRGDTAGTRRFAARAARVWEIVAEARETGMAFLEEHAGYVRTGYHRGSGTESRAELGQWQQARDWVRASFAQHTSRAGDPQLHEHNLVLNLAPTEADGKWRRFDSKHFYRYKAAFSAIVAAEIERMLTAEEGLVWVPRADGHGREIAGVPQKAVETFSSRRQTITDLAAQVAAQREAEWGRKPDARQMDQIMRDITQRTRQGKEEKPLDLAAALHEWQDKAKDADLASLRDIYHSITAEARAQAGRDQVVTGLARGIAWQLARETGAAPDAAQMTRIEGYARWITRRGEITGPFDVAALARSFTALQHVGLQAERDIRRDTALAQAQHAQTLRQQAAERAAAHAYAVAYPVQGAHGLSEAEAGQVMAEAVAVLQAQRPTWTKADLIGVIGCCLPGHAHADRSVLEALAERALAGDTGERVALLSAPEWPVVPPSLRRPDGESVFRPHGAERYASQAQLGLEEQLLALAQATGAPRLHPDEAARLLGAARDWLDARLRPETPAAAAVPEVTGSGLRMEQAAAAYFILTSLRRAEVLVGPPGTGKTWTATEMARAWTAAGMGPVVALTTSNNARNVIRDEAARHGVTLQAHNITRWLGRSETGAALTPVEVAPGSLIVVDEASMVPLAHLAAVIRRADRHGAKVAVTGDPLQLQAPEGGGMDLLDRHLGHVELSEAARFRQAWEREATLRLRQGDITVLADYREHDRLHAATAEQAADEAARAYLHDRLSGKDTLLMCGSEALAAELSRRIRDDLIHWDIVDGHGPAVTLMNGYQASAGDWVMARRNLNRVSAGEEGRGLANRDILRIITADADGSGLRVLVERLTGRDPATGTEQWSAPFKLERSYLWEHAHLAYAVTFHAAEGRTVDSGIAVFTGAEDRQTVTVAMTRGRDTNHAYVITGWGIADPKPGPEPAPELARRARIRAEWAGLDPNAAAMTEGTHKDATAEEILGRCLDNDGRELSATGTREAEWSDADRLDVLGYQWRHMHRQASQHRYEQALREVLGTETAGQVGQDPAATWLWRTLREADAAGLDGPAALRRAVAGGPLDGADSVAKVLDWRIRQQTAGMPALAARPWTEQVPQTGGVDTDRYARELAQAMDDRARRLGEHAAEHPPAWAQALGPVPDHPVDRAEWEHKASLIAAYREMWGHVHPHEPIGPRPGDHSPEARAMWQATAEALGYVPGQMREHSDGQLWAWRTTWHREMAWAPEYKGEELALVRGEIRRAEIDADRARRNAQAAATTEARQRLEQLAAVHADWEQTVRGLAGRLAEAQAGYDAWEVATAPTRERAIAADAELRRRHPETWIEPLRSQHAEPGRPPAAPIGTGSPAPESGTAAPAAGHEARGLAERIPVTDAEIAAASARPRATPAPDPAEAAKWRAEQTARIDADRRARAEAAARACPVTDAEIAGYGTGQHEPEPRPVPRPALGTREPARTEAGTPVLASQAAKMDQIHQQVREISARLDQVAMARARQAEAKAAEVTSMSVPSQDPDLAPSAAWIDTVQARQQETVRHEPMPRVPAAEAIQASAEATADASLGDFEAAD
jgi:conjugative relaxase-like TrwC/TraI family protein